MDNVLSWVLSSAQAQEVASQTAAAAESSPLMGLMPIVMMVVLFYVMLIRPQQKKMNEHKKMVAALRRGDKILTSGGIFATIAKVEDDVLQIEIAPDVKVKLDKGSVLSVITRSEPADGSVVETTEKKKVKAND
jgi:preprotein translocase subunit YajC